jgi:hypothetical protein
MRDFVDERQSGLLRQIVPRVHNSNETERSGRVTKRGSKVGPYGSGAMRADRQTLQPISAQLFTKALAAGEEPAAAWLANSAASAIGR